MSKARFRHHSSHVPNLIDELSPAKELRLNQFGTAVLVRCSNVVKFDKVSNLTCAEPNALIMTMYNLPMMYSYIRFDTQYAV